MSSDDVSRRAFMRTAGGAAAAAGAATATAGTAAAQEVAPDWPSGAEGNVGSYTDARGQDSVTISVGAGDQGLAFDPTLVWVDEGTTITWEWTGAGGDHNVQTVDGGGPASLDSGSPVGEEGYTYEYETSSEDAGITHYHCVPHTAVGMHGGIAVGEDVATVETGGGGSSNAVFVPDAARALGIATFIAMVSTLGLAFVFMKYGGTITGREQG
ncbi:halocyanin domain-containing protein [Halorubrum sp. Atlit-8R]|uniref:halocyanin domain-containing protein n=1 Tax=unclassified Halorubrum TaxID=2642239 RepID=UPI000EF1C76E|nr:MULTISPECIES: halocyanin domain-containing protein [unclassified Halorubrum]RLM71264.1 halocyanin domain-containing protein [Halorubrum sp. Atlit-9R]RLM72132.1 halocyanin domain-containing protein [Halorubrum sp. Atlit-9R]RLM82583.1 halocyanin domain-containing protein [Halorubrum sp. Atlit-8R]